MTKADTFGVASSEQCSAEDQRACLLLQKWRSRHIRSCCFQFFIVFGETLLLSLWLVFLCIGVETGVTNYCHKRNLQY
jgi:hypothetical protein